MGGRPAVTRRRSGKGWVFYVGVDSTDDQFYEEVARAVGEAAGLKPLISAPYGVEVTSRQDGATTYFFLLNLGETPHDLIELPQPMDDLLQEKRQVKSVSLEPLGVVVLALRA
jgi:beta-galactosidase